MKKIVHVQVVPKLSGVQQVSLDILSNLSFDYDKYIIFGGEADLSSDFLSLFESKGIKIICIKSLRRNISFLDFKATCELYRLFRKYDFDIIHTNSTKPGIVARFAAKLAGCKFVIHSVHGIAYHKFETIPKRIFYYIIECFFCLFSDVIVSVNQYYLNYYPFIKNKRCIYNAITLVPKSNGLSINTPKNEKFRVGFLSRLDPQKDPITLLKALKYGLDTKLFVRKNIVFIVAGDGLLRDECNNFVNENGLEDVVVFKDWVSDKENFYRNIDVLCLPSIHEAFGLVLGEAAIFCIPSIATNVEGIPEVIENGKTGFLIDVKDYKNLARKIHVYANDEALRLGHGINANKKVISEFNLNIMMRKYEELYNQSNLQ